MTITDTEINIYERVRRCSRWVLLWDGVHHKEGRIRKNYLGSQATLASLISSRFIKTRYWSFLSFGCLLRLCKCHSSTACKSGGWMDLAFWNAITYVSFHLSDEEPRQTHTHTDMPLSWWSSKAGNVRINYGVLVPSPAFLGGSYISIMLLIAISTTLDRAFGGEKVITSYDPPSRPRTY